MTLQELESEFSKIDLPKFDNTRLDKCTVILDANMFVDTSISTLKNGTKNRAYLPYYDRLLNFYNLIKNDAKTNRRNKTQVVAG